LSELITDNIQVVYIFYVITCY